ncbi:Murein DD-endopeptidase MepM [compost metagenome]
MLGSVLGKVDSNWVATRFMDAYAFETKTGRKLRAGAKFSFLLEKKYEGVHFIKYGEILQTSLQIGNRTVAKHFVRSQSGGVFIDKEDLLENKFFYSPVDYLRIASHFQPNRRHPITKRLQPHLGVDFEGPAGKHVFAPRSGVVVRYGRNHAAGNYIVIKHAQGIESSYNHLSRIASNIRTGATVSTGEIIGEIGNTGYSTRPHLHFAVRKNGKMVDPLLMMKAYPSRMESLVQSRIASF